MLRPIRNLYDLVSSRNLALFQYAKVKSRPVTSNQFRGHLRFVHAYANAIAGNPRLGNLEQSRTDAIAVTDAHFGVRQAVNCEILSKLSVREIFAPDFALPISIGFQLINHYGTIQPSVATQISLTVPIDVEPPGHNTPWNWAFPDTRVDRLTPPVDVRREPDIDRDKPCCQRILPFHGETDNVGETVSEPTTN